MKKRLAAHTRRALVIVLATASTQLPANYARAQAPDDSPYVHVDRSARLRAGSPPPVYPELLRRAHIEGEVAAQFVVDTLGRVEPATFRVLKSTHEMFTSAVRNGPSKLRFVPGVNRGKRVRQQIAGAFEFPPGRVAADTQPTPFVFRNPFP